ncbi:MAG: hypothetical protein ACFE7R_11250, partial [Candidatus Hodarchaeota archaeon]
LSIFHDIKILFFYEISQAPFTKLDNRILFHQLFLQPDRPCFATTAREMILKHLAFRYEERYLGLVITRSIGFS